ncbi:prefoldin subunit alpha [Candidatus Woesearchaeota archaeon]|nr:prefoldin subunit alpha [Candidatus Woesearchaeota archaeon]
MNHNKESVLELQNNDDKIKQIQKHIETLDGQLQEVLTMENIINEFNETKAGSQLRIPIADGIFVKARLDDNEDILVNVGSSVAVKKTIPEVQEMILKQKEELTAYRANILVQLQQLIARSEELQNKLKKQ